MLKFNAHWPDVRVGDTYFVLGHGHTSRHEWKKIAKMPWYGRLDKKYTLPFPEISLQQAYEHHCRLEGGEPAWIESLSPRMQRRLRYGWLCSDNFDPLAILPYREELGFSFAVHDDDLIHDVCNALRVFRLAQIRQLGFLHDPVMNELAGNNGMAMLFEHTRYMHSLTVMATASLMGLRCELSPYDLLHLRVAALTHDVLTPAGGDSIKFIDPEAFDEDAHYPEIFQDNPEWDTVRDRYGLNEKLLATTVQGTGLLGQLLDFADKLSYVAHDFDAYMKGCDPRAFQNFKSPKSIMAIWKFQNEASHPLCDLWNHIVIRDGRAIITDGKRLAEFLKLRALMFRHLYYNPRARYREQMLGILIVAPFYQRGFIAREQLIKMNDETLYALIDELSGSKNFSWEVSRSDLAPDIESYASIGIAKERAQTLITADPSLLVMFESFPSVSSKAVQYLVMDREGAPQPFSQLYPDEADEILALGTDPKPVKLYVLPIKEITRLISPELQGVLLEEQRKRIGLE